MNSTTLAAKGNGTHIEPLGADALPDDLLRLLARSADGVFAVDGKQRIMFWSKAAEELLGRPAKQVLGKHCYEVVLGRDYEGHPFCRRNCPTIRAARRGQSVPNYDVACQRGGEDVWLNISIVPVSSQATGGPLAIHLIRDVSARRRFECLAQAALETVSRFMPDHSSSSDHDGGPYPVPGPSLTARELEILRLLARGLDTPALTRTLGLSRATVRNHIQRVLAKLGAHNRLEAVVQGARYHLI